jgi:hypothetical protein
MSFALDPEIDPVKKAIVCCIDILRPFALEGQSKGGTDEDLTRITGLVFPTDASTTRA